MGTLFNIYGYESESNLGFSKYAVFLYIVAVIFRKEIIIESGSWRKSNFQA